MLRVGFRAYVPSRVFYRTFTVGFPSRATGGNAGNVQTFVPQSKPLGIDRTVESNIQSDTNRLSKTLTKFWEKVDTVFNEETKKYEVQLDGKTLKTPLGFPMALPDDKQIFAHLVQHEWSNLPDLKIQTSSLPLTSIAARSIDLLNANEKYEENSDFVAKVGRIDDIKLNLLRYLDTDTCLIFTTLDEYEGKLRARQDELYQPLIKEHEDFFTNWAIKRGNLLPSKDYKVTLEFLDCETDGLRGNQQNLTTQSIVLDWMNHLSIYELVALEKAILTSKSFLCGISLLRSNVSNTERQQELFQVNKSTPDNHYFKTIDEVIELGNLETIFQTNQWGEVEDTHDVDKVDWLRNLTSAALLCH